MWRIENLGELGIFALVFRKNEGKWAKNILFPLVLLYCCRATRDEQVWQRDTSTKNISLPILFVWVLFLFYRSCFVCMCFIWNFLCVSVVALFSGNKGETGWTALSTGIYLSPSQFVYWIVTPEYISHCQLFVYWIFLFRTHGGSTFCG